MSRPQKSLSSWCCAMSFKWEEGFPLSTKQPLQSPERSAFLGEIGVENGKGILSSSRTVHSQVVEICRNVTPWHLWWCDGIVEDDCFYLDGRMKQLLHDQLLQTVQWQRSLWALMAHTWTFNNGPSCSLAGEILCVISTEQNQYLWIQICLFAFFSPGSDTKRLCSASAKI